MNDLYEALETCLQDIEQGADLDTVLVRYPDLADELRPILEASRNASSLAVSAPSAEVVRRNRSRVLQRAAQLRESKRSSRRIWFASLRRMVVTLAVVAILFASGTGLVRAASNTLPGDQLYPVKRTWEDVLVFMTFDSQQRNALEVEHENERITELKDLFAAKRSGETLVWDTAQRKELRRLPGNAPALFCQESQDGQRVLVMDKANRASVWRTADWRETVHWRVERADCCALSPDGSLFATAREKGLVTLWDTSTGKELGTVTHIKEDTTRLAFSANSRWLAAASDAGPVTVWDRDSRRPVAVLSGHLLSTTALAVSPDGHRLATGSLDKDAVKLWDTSTWQELLTLEVPGGSLSELAFTSDGTRLLARTQSGDLLVWTAPLRSLP